MDTELLLKINKIITETNEAKTFLLTEVNSKKIAYLPGQFLTLSFSVNGEEFRRSYSICTAPFELPIIGITIKKVQGGYASNFLVDNLKEGDIVQALPPLGKFIIEPFAEFKRKIILFGAGSGITPLMSIIKSVLYIEPQSEIVLLNGNRNLDSIIYRKELSDLEKSYENRFRVIHVLSQPEAGRKGLKGRITKELVVNFLQEYGNCKGVHFYLCGPAGMMNQTISALETLNIEPERIHTEYFSVVILQNGIINDNELKSRKVTIIFEGKEHLIDVEQGDSILESALRQGLDLPNSCQIGQCSSCKAKLISGKLNLVEQTALSDEEISQGYCLTCVGFPLSDDIVIDYDATKNF